METLAFGSSDNGIVGTCLLQALSKSLKFVNRIQKYLLRQFDSPLRPCCFDLVTVIRKCKDCNKFKSFGLKNKQKLKTDKNRCKVMVQQSRRQADQNLKLSANTAVFKNESLIIGGPGPPGLSLASALGNSIE